MTTGQLIAVEARAWLGTRFKHQGRVMKTASHSGGVDCLGLLIGVAKTLDLHGVDKETGEALRLADLDSINYGHRPDGENLRRTLERYLSVVDGDWQAGDIMLCNLDGNPQHLAIVGSVYGCQLLVDGFDAKHMALSGSPLAGEQKNRRFFVGGNNGCSLPPTRKSVASLDFLTPPQGGSRSNKNSRYYQPSTETCQPTIIHAYAQARQVVEHGLDDFWRQSVVGVYRVNML